MDRLEGSDGNYHLDTFNRLALRDAGYGAGRDHAAVDRKDVVGDDYERARAHLGLGGM